MFSELTSAASDLHQDHGLALYLRAYQVSKISWFQFKNIFLFSNPYLYQHFLLIQDSSPMKQQWNKWGLTGWKLQFKAELTETQNLQVKMQLREFIFSIQAVISHMPEKCGWTISNIISNACEEASPDKWWNHIHPNLRHTKRDTIS